MQQTIKDVNQSLVDDNMVSMDKIGSANFYWSFPAKLCLDRLNAKENLIRQIASSEQQCEKIAASIETAKETRKAADRAEKIDHLNSLIAQEKEYDAIIEANKYNDPAEINRIKGDISKIVDSVNRWTDNIYAVKKYLMKKANRSSKEADKMLQITDSFDYLTADEPPKKMAKR